mmetsp:Transcript_12165/g.19209  ORF Transcript_12165/g.19209 Transcript_12165/m.19209 type:complete len:80 (-) Transcript_12165:369-608(-)
MSVRSIGLWEHMEEPSFIPLDDLDLDAQVEATAYLLMPGLAHLAQSAHMFGENCTPQVDVEAILEEFVNHVPVRLLQVV